MQNKFTVFNFLILILCLAGIANFASASVSFEYRVDRFSVGNFTDEFDNGLNNWNTNWGTVNAADGFAIFTDPGTEINYPGYEHITLNISDILLTARTETGQSFTAESVWSADYLPEAPGGFFGQYFRDFGGNTFFTVNLSNFSPAVTEAFGDYGAPGPLVSFAEISVFGERSDVQTFSVDPASITGDFVFQLMYDQTLGEISAHFSSDGGLTFISPFNSWSSSGVGSHLLVGDPIEAPVPVPAAAWLFGSALLGLVVRRKLG
ncbi:MAG: PEP-CTERM sorting domain-containing protein [Pseudomonadales bacterium]